jgi:5-methylcytosine-specific restriction endonuclease McrA
VGGDSRNLPSTDGKDRAEYDFARRVTRLSSADFATGLPSCPLLTLGVLHARFWAHDDENLDRIRESRATGHREAKNFGVYSACMETTIPALTPYSLEHVSDDDLHASTRRLVGRSNQLLAALLAHLAEVEARGIHRERACASLSTYCVYELRMSEDEAFRRARASKIARQFPILFEQVATGEIHLTGILLLGSHLTEENHVEVLARAKHRTKKEIKRLVRMLHPLPDVPALVEPLGPEPRSIAGNPSWSQMVEAHAPEIRELSPGERPKDWIADAVAGTAVEAATEADSDAHGEAAGGANPEATPSQALAPLRYRVQFTATQEYVDLLETAKDLLAHAVPSRSIEEVHLRAMRALVIELKKRKIGATSESSRKGQQSSSEQSYTESAVAGGDARAAESPRQRGANTSAGPRQRGANTSADSRQRQRGRYVPRAVRRAVWARDRGRCTYVDAMGQRCRETGGLELDHVDPHARGGPPTVSNLRLRCRCHNALTAEHEFGRDFIAAQIVANRRTARHA